MIHSFFFHSLISIGRTKHKHFPTSISCTASFCETNDCVADWVSVRYYGFIADKVFNSITKLSARARPRFRATENMRNFSSNFSHLHRSERWSSPTKQTKHLKSSGLKACRLFTLYRSSGKFNANCDPRAAQRARSFSSKLKHHPHTASTTTIESL